MRVIIIGAGPAGISAALYARRGGAEVTVAAKGSGALSGAEWVENYYGFAEPVSGAELERQGKVFADPMRGTRLFLRRGHGAGHSLCRESGNLRGAASASARAVTHSFTAGKKSPSSVREHMRSMRLGFYCRMPPMYVC